MVSVRVKQVYRGNKIDTCVFLFLKKHTHALKTRNFFPFPQTHHIYTIHLASSFLYATHADH